MSMQDIEKQEERLYHIFRSAEFLSARGLANEVPLFIQCYSPRQEDAMIRTVQHLTQRLQNSGVAVKRFDLFELVMAELKEAEIEEDLLRDEHTYDKSDMLETLENFSDPEIICQRLVSGIDHNTQLILITGCGHVFPFLRTHAILEGLQPKMECKSPIVFFFPGQYPKDQQAGPQLQLFAGNAGTSAPKIHKSYYRAINLDDYYFSETEI